MDNKLKILRFLGKNIGASFTLRELSASLKIPYATFHREVSKTQDLIILDKKGSAILASLKSSPEAKSYLAVSSYEEKKEFLIKSPVIRKISEELGSNEIVLLFGSYAKGTQTAKSDIDLLIVNKKGEKSISFSKYELLFKIKINPIFVSQKEFTEMLKEKEENVGKQALKNHIILANEFQFWEMVLNAVG